MEEETQRQGGFDRRGPSTSVARPACAFPQVSRLR